MKSWRLLLPGILLIASLALPATAAYGAPTVPPPGPPTNVTAIAGDHSATVSWQSPVILTIYRMAGYRITVYSNGRLAYPWQVIAPANATQWTVNGLQNGVSYVFTVQARISTLVNPVAISDWSAPSIPSAAVIPGAVPGPPTGVDVHASYTTAVLTWSAPASGPVVSYRVNVFKRDGNGVFQSVSNPLVAYSSVSTLATVMQLDSSAVYRFTIQAGNGLGWGPESAVSASITPNAAVPLPPVTTSATAGDGSISVAWTGPYQTGVSHYLVLVSLQSGELATYRDGVTASPITINGLTNGVAYTVQVRTIDVNHMMSIGKPGTVVPAPPAVPASPINLAAKPADRSVSLTWQAPFANANAPIDHYVVTLYAISAPGASVQGLYPAWQATNVTTTWTVVMGLANGQRYAALVWSVSSSGTTSDIARVEFTPATVPSLPQAVIVTPGANQATVTWLAPVTNGGSPITGYVVTATTGSSSDTLTMTVGPAANAAIVTGLSLNKTYTFSVVAVNAMGQSGPAFAPTTVTLATVPSAPGNMSVVPGDGVVQVRWDPPSTDGGSPITGYQVSASDGIHAPIVVSVDARSTITIISGLTNNTLYSVSVVAINGLGRSLSAWTWATPRNVPPTITVPQSTTVHHGDQVTASVSASVPNPNDHLTITASGLPNGVTFSDHGNGTASLGGKAEVPAGTYTITLWATDGHSTPVAATTTLVVARELAEIRPFATAPFNVVLRKSGQTVAKSITVRATAREVTDSAGYADIREAAPITYTLTSIDTGATYTGTANTTGGGIEGALTTKYTFHNVPIGVYELKISVGGNFYQGQAEAMVTVWNSAIRGAINGTGAVPVSGAQSSATFQLHLTANGKGKLTGSVTYTERSTIDPGQTVKHAFTATSIRSLVIKGNRAYIQGYGTLDGVGGHQFVITVVDNHTKGTSDKFGLRVIGGDFSTVSALTFGPTALTSGHVVLTRT